MHDSYDMSILIDYYLTMRNPNIYINHYFLRDLLGVLRDKIQNRTLEYQLLGIGRKKLFKTR